MRRETYTRKARRVRVAEIRLARLHSRKRRCTKQRVTQEYLIKDFKLRAAGLPAFAKQSCEFRGNKYRIKKAMRIVAPAVMCLDEAYAEILGYIYQLRWIFFSREGISSSRRRKVVFADLEGVSKLTLPAALALVAEYDRSLRAKNLAARDIDFTRWPAHVRRLLSDLGFFELVGVERPSLCDKLGSEHLKWFKFRTSDRVQPEEIGSILQEFSSAGGQSIERFKVYEAIIEAIGNCWHHAYPQHVARALEPCIRHWWLAGCLDVSTDVVEIAVYDQGIGIPKSLKHQNMLGKICAHAGIDVASPDHETISAAIRYGKTSVEKPGRGNGLWEMSELVRRLPESYMTIWSGAGRVVVAANGPEMKSSLAKPFPGTLICWRIKLPSA